MAFGFAAKLHYWSEQVVTDSTPGQAAAAAWTLRLTSALLRCNLLCSPLLTWRQWRPIAGPWQYVIRGRHLTRADIRRHNSQHGAPQCDSPMLTCDSRMSKGCVRHQSNGRQL